MDEDWRLQGQERYLLGRVVRWATWSTPREDWDHDHCSFCWAEFSDRPIDEHTNYNAGWVTADDNYSWICEVCFRDFRDRFGWRVDPAAPGPAADREPFANEPPRMGVDGHGPMT